MLWHSMMARLIPQGQLLQGKFRLVCDVRQNFVHRICVQISLRMRRLFTATRASKPRVTGSIPVGQANKINNLRGIQVSFFEPKIPCVGTA